MTTTLQAIKHVRQAWHYYALLGVHAGSTPAELQAARRVLALVLHPDRTDLPAAPAAMAAVNVAYDVLTDAKQAKKYRAGLGSVACVVCGGAGCRKKQQGFNKVVRTVCPECLGSGVSKRKGKS